jgi:uncharacterized membrane protein HdeD (DUF308 family)
LIAAQQKGEPMTALSPLGVPSPGLPHLIARSWSYFLLRGLVAIAFGILIIVWPHVTLIALIWTFGFYAIADGILAIAAAMVSRGERAVPAWWLLLVGALGILVGIIVFCYPGETALVLLTFIAFWSLFRGCAEIAGAIQMRKQINNEWLLILDGAMSVLFGLFLLISPGAGALALLLVIGIYAIVLGALLVGVAMRLRRFQKATA